MEAFASTDTTIASKTPPPEKQKPNFAPTGRLAVESNTVKSAAGTTIILKYHEPPESRKASAAHPWRLYVFKESQILDTVLLHERSCWLIGREAAVVDYLVEHPSTSKQHAVIQFRYVEKRNEFGDKTGKVRPYIIDLESANGTKVNGDLVPAGRYLELRDGDIVTFGESKREYVLQLPPPDG
jgi:smad nuclear-interacting protein 1